MTETQKLRCSDCKKMHPVGKFHKNKSFARGYDYVCKESHLKRARARRIRRKENLARAHEMGLLI